MKSLYHEWTFVKYHEWTFEIQGVGIEYIHRLDSFTDTVSFCWHTLSVEECTESGASRHLSILFLVPWIIHISGKKPSVSIKCLGVSSTFALQARLSFDLRVKHCPASLKESWGEQGSPSHMRLYWKVLIRCEWSPFCERKKTRGKRRK